MYYTLFVDESGDEGISNIRSAANQAGASPWFFLGAFLIPDIRITEVRSEIDACRSKLNSNLHCSQLGHEKLVYFFKQIALYPIKCFSLISDKSGLQRGGYIGQVTPERFYNKNVKYLFEKVGDFCSLNNIHVHSIIFEKKANKDYERLSNFLRVVRLTPFYSQSRSLIHLDLQNLEAKTKADESLLTISDAIAYSLYRSCIQHPLGFTEHRYLNEIRKKLYCNNKGLIAEFGIKAVPDFDSLRINGDDINFLKTLNTDKVPMIANNAA